MANRFRVKSALSEAALGRSALKIPGIQNAKEQVGICLYVIFHFIEVYVYDC